MSTETAAKGTMPPTAPALGDFTYPDFYRAMAERERLQVSRDEATWSEKHSQPDRSVDVLLNFGCNVRQTPHLMREAVAVLEVLGVDFAAVAGQQYCCGKPYSGQGLKDAAVRVVQASVKRMAEFRPQREIQWCSACEMQFHDVVEPDIGIEFQSEGLAKFLVEKLRELGDAVPWKKEIDIRAVIHGHLGEHAVRDAHPPVTMDLLRLVPGVKVIGYADTPALAFCDNQGMKIKSIGTEEYLAAQAALEGYVREQNADTLVTLYHSCTRELSKFASERLPIRHYIDVVAEALGVQKPDRFSEYWRLGDAEAVKEASRSNWESWGYTEEQALALAHKYFLPTYGRDVTACPCNGQCTQTGANWLGVQKTSSLKELPQVSNS